MNLDPRWSVEPDLLSLRIAVMKAEHERIEAMFQKLKARLLNIFTAKALVQATATIAALQVPWGLMVDNKAAILAGLATVKEAAAAGDRIRLTIAVLGFGFTVTNILRKHPETRTS